MEGKACPSLFSISAGGGRGPGGAKICQSQVSPFQGGQGFASTICNALREFQHCQWRWRARLTNEWKTSDAFSKKLVFQRRRRPMLPKTVRPSDRSVPIIGNQTLYSVSNYWDVKDKGGQCSKSHVKKSAKKTSQVKCILVSVFNKILHFPT